MRPSNYNYLKRMWTRELCKSGGCMTSIIFFPFRIVVWILALIFKGIFSISKSNNKKEDYFENLHKESQREQMLAACSYGADIPNDDIFYSEEYQAFIILTECEPSTKALQYCMKIGYMHAMEILNRLEALEAIEIKDNNQIEVLITKEELINRMK